MVADARAARAGRPVLAISRADSASVAALRDWVLGGLSAFRRGGWTAQDPGPMAPHFHASEDGGYSHSHSHDGEHDHLAQADSIGDRAATPWM
jgi:urease accessory protein